MTSLILISIHFLFQQLIENHIQIVAESDETSCVRDIIFLKEEVLDSDEDNSINFDTTRENYDGTTLNIHEQLFNMMRYDQKTGVRRKRISSIHLIQFYCQTCDRSTKMVKKVSACLNCQTPLQYECIACKKRYKSLKSAQTHLQYERDGVVSKCPYCDFKTLRVYNLRSHIANKHTEMRSDDYYKCEKCGKKFKTRENLSKHWRHLCGSKQEPMQCQYCSFSSKYKWAMRIHMVNRHTDVVDVTNEHICNNCGRMYKSFYHYQKHFELHCGKARQPKKLYHCCHCEYTSTDRWLFAHHLQKKHEDIVGTLAISLKKRKYL